jgi:hypothetical protein
MVLSKRQSGKVARSIFQLRKRYSRPGSRLESEAPANEAFDFQAI